MLMIRRSFSLLVHQCDSCNLASIGQLHHYKRSRNGQLRRRPWIDNHPTTPQALPSGYALGQIKICISPQAMPQGPRRPPQAMP
ncbi:hypothetical protein T07_10206 [Trichinella nelsoni]|uniref:Uncharacterized protein n=1 Tax=Trichinella nelsoni TaxID=6336 RepID=A0A0V0RSS2_9BILA|nr:hypothetical protein T07_10206 [Trichinella nelsoni]